MRSSETRGSTFRGPRQGLWRALKVSAVALGIGLVMASGAARAGDDDDDDDNSDDNGSNDSYDDDDDNNANISGPTTRSIPRLFGQDLNPANGTVASRHRNTIHGAHQSHLNNTSMEPGKPGPLYSLYLLDNSLCIGSFIKNSAPLFDNND